MAQWGFAIFLGTFVCFHAVVAFGDETYDIRPTAVWSPTPTWPPEKATLNNMIDGDLATCCCFLNDASKDKKSKLGGAAPVTARFVLDLDKRQKIGGIRFVAQKSWANCLPEYISVFACDDPQGKVNVRCLKDSYWLPPVNTYNVAFAAWKPIETRYVSVRIDDSYDRWRGGCDWWRGANPGRDRSQYHLNKKLRTGFGWWWGVWQGVVARLPQIAGGPLYDFTGRGTVQIAEVSCFCGQPADLPIANAPDVAYPANRLHRDWMYQDVGATNVSLVANSTPSGRKDPLGRDISMCFSSKKDSVVEQAMVQKTLDELKRCNVNVSPMQQEMQSLTSVPGCDARWKTLYFKACERRRQERLKILRQSASQFIYVKHYVFGGWTHLVPTDEVTDEQFFERNPDFHEGSQLCLATIYEDGTISNEVLLEKPHGIIRDPNLSFDAKTLIFSMRDNFDTDDNHLYTMDMADRKVRQITRSPTINGKTVPCSDTEPCFAPDGSVIFQSTRCGNLDVCWVHPTSNLYACDIEGRYIRRLAFDQVRTLYPQLLNDGRIIFTRWEYNDRNPFFLQSLFVMNPDGTAQSALYGNNSDYPAALIHARAIPNSDKIIAVIGGHHLLQKGKLAIIDHAKGSEGNSGIEYVAGASPDEKPGRRPSNIHAPFDRWSYDLFGQVGPQWQYPYAFDESHYLVAFSPEGFQFLKGPFGAPFGVYYMTDSGDRELLAFDWGNSCGQAIPVIPRKQPPVKPSQVDWRKNWGTFYVQNVYAGPGLEGVKRGTAKRLRVVALEYRAAGITKNFNRGSAGDSHINTPVAIDNGSQDVKHVLGEVNIEDDGSVYFETPARNAVYFQVLDERGRCMQTMRSWTMLQPGEQIGCVGCHENKTQTGLPAAKTLAAFQKPPQKLQSLLGQPPHPLMTRLEKERLLDDVNAFLGVNAPRSLDANAPVDGFSYTQMVQPILDKHCVVCHQGNVHDPDLKKRSRLRLTGEILPFGSFAGLRQFTQSYVALTAKGNCTPLVNWIHPESRAAMLPSCSCGSIQSKLMDYLESSHYNVQITDAEKRTVACWIDLAIPFCGSYPQANAWNKRDDRWRVETDTWSKPQLELYDYFQKKRVVFAKEELENVKALLQDTKK